MMRGDILQASYHQLVPHRQVMIQEILQRKGRRGRLGSGSFLSITPSKRNESSCPEKGRGAGFTNVFGMLLSLLNTCIYPSFQTKKLHNLYC